MFDFFDSSRSVARRLVFLIDGWLEDARGT
jgi:hypothetical protein